MQPASARHEFAVVADGLVKHYGDVVALGGVSFSVPAGSVLGLLGPNGAGKTTAVRVLTTLTQPTSGSAHVLGLDVVKDATKVRASIGLAGQYAALDENLTAAENLRLVGRLAHLSRPEVAARSALLLAQFELAHTGTRLVRTFSGGMRRRLDLAASLVHRPPVLFLDEPTTGLDPMGRNGLWAVIDQLVEEGTTVVLTTQYLEEADRLADQIVVIDRGLVIADGTAEELKGRLGRTVIEMTFERAETAASAGQVLDGVGDVAIDDSTVRVSVRDGGRAVFAAARALDGAQLEPVTMQLREPTLDDVFLSLTGHRAEAEVAIEAEATAAPPRRRFGARRRTR